MGQPAGACVTARPTGCAEGGQGRWGRPGARWLAPNHPMRSWLAPLCLACDGIGQLPFHREAHAHQATLKEACGQPAPSVHHFCCQLACITRLWFRRWPARLKPPTRSEFALAQGNGGRRGVHPGGGPGGHGVPRAREVRTSDGCAPRQGGVPVALACCLAGRVAAAPRPRAGLPAPPAGAAPFVGTMGWPRQAPALSSWARDTSTGC